MLYNYTTQFTDELLLHAIVYHLPSRATPPPTPATSHELACGTGSKAALPAEAPSVDWWIVWRRTLHSSRHVRCTLTHCQLSSANRSTSPPHRLANTLARWVLLRPHITRTGDALDLMCAHLASPSSASLLGFERASDLELLVSVTKQLVQQQQQHPLECPEANRPGSTPEDLATETLVDLSSPSGDRHHLVREFLSTPPEHVAA